MNEQKKQLLLLNMCGLSGARKLKKMLDVFGSLDGIIGADCARIKKVSGPGSRLGENLAKNLQKRSVDEEIDLLKREGVEVISINETDYPEALKEIYDPPLILYLKGTLKPEDGRAIAVVGSRRASLYGLDNAKRISSALVRRGITIVSGLARGIDKAAHQGALDAGGRTLAVLGSGLLNLYPPEHKDLAAAIAESGAVISPFPLRELPQTYNFPNRNRIISGLSRGTFVVEAAVRSGALITARYALEEGKEVFALPGRVDKPVAAGANALIRQGAKLVMDAEDILEEIKGLALDKPDGPGNEDIQAKTTPSGYGQIVQALGEECCRVYSVLTASPTHIDRIIEASGVNFSRALSLLMKLELKSVVKEFPGKYYALRK